MIRKIIQYLLWLEAKLILWRYYPLIIWVSGSCGKSSTKEAIYYALKNYFLVDKSSENLNTEIGVPLTIIRGKDAKRNIYLWIYNFLHAIFLFVFKDKNYPKILILEMSEDHPGIMKYFFNLTHPKIGVISWINQIPVHAVFFNRAEEVHQEIQNLVILLPKDGIAIINTDNDLSREIINKIRAKVITHGFKNADVLISDYSLFAEEKNIFNLGMTLRIEYQGSYIPLKLKNIFGKPQAYAISAAIAIGLALDLNLVEIAEGLGEYKVLKARTHLIPAINSALILDDSYNSNPDALKAALETYEEIINLMEKESLFNLKRRILVIGSMNELGKYTQKAHQEIAPLLIKNADLIFLVGEYTKTTLEECKKLGFKEDNIFWFKDSKEAAKTLKEIIREGDFILIKGSRGIHMEEVTLALMQEPGKAKEYLSFEEPK
jgi:UDP-N-acetylmuramoyl-tripeptide--D-alanyl-D-alanine ligase